MWTFNTGDCLIWVTLWEGLTVTLKYLQTWLIDWLKSKHYKTGENTGKSFTFYLWGLQ